ncbi:MAG TPA: secretin N-terminal domain-containing protein [Candidatus Omnitrophota bacterium]|nr:secretin N-terminal domain-containing protein [Candidatus Omnitrophota bacterium]
MIKHKSNPKRRMLFFSVFVLAIFCLMISITNVFAQAPKPIVIPSEEEPLLDRLDRTISLDVRDMNIVDIVKFLALKGDFNVVISPSVDGRATVLLKQVSIKDALDIVIIANKLAYKIEKNIVQIMTSGEFETLFGRSFGDKREVSIVHLNYSKPSYVLAALDSIRSNIGKIIIDEDTGSVVIIDTPEAIAQMKVSIEKMEKPLETFVYSLQYARADVVAEKLKSRIDAKAVGAITSDERSNKLIVRVFPGRLKEIKDLIKDLDTPTKEVLVTARILQVVLKPKYDMGIDWQLDFRKSSDDQIKKLSFQNTYLNKDNMTTNDKLYSQFGQIAFGDFSQDTFEFAIRSLEQVSDAKILSNPQILVTNNQEARIHVGDTVPYIISTTSGTGDNAITSEDVRFVDVGLKLNVTPNINDDGYVTMRLRPEISTVVGSIQSRASSGIPQVNKTEVETTVMVKDGNTIVMGGLKKDNKSHSKKGFPVLMNLPVVGPLFGRTSDDFEQTEIVILITPHIVTGNNKDFNKIKGQIKPYKEYTTK